MKNDFENFALSMGIGSARLNQYNKMITPTSGVINPTIIEERQLNIAAMDVFSRLQMDRIIFLGDEINSDTSNIINAQLLFLNSTGSEDIKMFINSPGGNVNAGLSILDTMYFIKPDVATYCIGMAASMGSILLSSGAKGKRYILPHGEVLVHQPLGGTGYAQASDIEIYNQHIQKYKNELFKILSDNTGQTIDKIKEDSDRDRWFDTKEALEYGLVDEIIGKK